MEKNRKCEICGNDDIKTGVCSSSIGAMSFNYCSVCAAKGAEHKTLLDVIGVEDIRNGFTFYDTKQDMYIDYKKNKPSPIKLNSGMEFITRSEYVEYYINDVKPYQRNRNEMEMEI